MDSMQAQMGAASVGLDELFSIVWNSKYPLLKEALDYLLHKDFDQSLVSMPYIGDNGTA